MRNKSYRLLHYVFALGTSLVIMLSCSTSNSVREIRAMREGDPSYYYNSSQSVKVSKSSGDAMTKPLFMQSKRANIELPYQEGTEKGGVMVSEEVTFINPEQVRNSSIRNNDNINLNEVQHLSEVVVTAKSRFAPERNGRVNVDFVIKVPKELISTNWRVTLSPKLIHNDSIVRLKEIILKGSEFSEKQKQAYKEYDDYLKSIVKKADYDSVFFDRESALKDIRSRQKFNYEEYHKEWSRQMEYEKWKAEKEKQDAVQYAKMKGYRDKIYNEYYRKAQEKAIKDYSKGKDTVGVVANYMKQYEKKLNAIIPQETMEEKLKNTPEKFRDIVASGRTLADIENNLISESDSSKIVKHRYLYEKIAENEMKESRKEEVFKEKIYFPYEEGMRLDTIVTGESDFAYYYKQDYPVTPGLKRLRITMNSKIDAVDKSDYTVRNSDTLSYFISSLSQLVDTSLINKQTKLYRDVYNSMSVYPKFASKNSNFNLNYKDNKEQIDKVLYTYRTFADEGKLIVDSVIVRVATSLDGGYEDNIELAMKRANSLKDYFKKVMPGVDVESIFKTRSVGEDWNNLVVQIKKRTDMPNKADILDMLSQAVNPDQSEIDIKKKYPADYKIIVDSIYPLLNKTDFIFNMHRPGMSDEMEIKTEVRQGYEEGLRLLQDREYWKALEILSDYPDYNTALCLLCMGYNAKAKEVLDRLPVTGNNEYLRTILSIRSGEDNEAIEHLLKACELDPTKIYRVPLDPEVSSLVSKYNLQPKMNERANAAEE